MTPEKVALIDNFKTQRRMASGRRPSRQAAEDAVRTLIEYAGDDPAREGLVGTPDRVVRSYDEFFCGLF